MEGARIVEGHQADTLIEERRPHDKRVADQYDKRTHAERNEDNHEPPPLGQGYSYAVTGYSYASRTREGRIDDPVPVMVRMVVPMPGRGVRMMVVRHASGV